MQHTLIPTRDRQRIHREYYTRVVIVLLGILTVATLLGIAGLAPTYLRAWLSNRTAQSAVESIKGNKADADIDKASEELTAANSMATFLASNIGEPAMSQVVKSVIIAKGSSVITSFALTRADAHTILIAITGTSPTRDELLAFKNRLEMQVTGSKVNVPIDQLARNTNLPFSLQFSQKLP